MHNLSNETRSFKETDQDIMIEKVMITSVILLFVTWIYVSNITLIRVLLKHQLATPPNTALRIILAISDIILASLTLYIPIPLLFMDKLFNLIVCGVLTDCCRATLAFSITVTATLSVERLIYFKIHCQLLAVVLHNTGDLLCHNGSHRWI